MVRSARNPATSLIKAPPVTDYEGRPWFRTRRICLTMDDWRIIGDALRTACPYAQFVRASTNKEGRGEAPPDITPTPHPLEQIRTSDPQYGEVWACFDPTWRLEYMPHPRMEGYWTYKFSFGLPYLRILSTSRIYPASSRAPEHLHAGTIDFAVQPRNQQQVAFMRALWSLLGKFSSNRHQVEVAYPGYDYFNPKTVTNLWVGHEAARWARDDPSRLLSYMHVADKGPVLAVGVRPIEEDWVERRLDALKKVDPAALARATELHPVEEYSGPSSARQAAIRRATFAKKRESSGS